MQPCIQRYTAVFQHAKIDQSTDCQPDSSAVARQSHHHQQQHQQQQNGKPSGRMRVESPRGGKMESSKGHLITAASIISKASKLRYKSSHLRRTSRRRHCFRARRLVAGCLALRSFNTIDVFERSTELMRSCAIVFVRGAVCLCDIARVCAFIGCSTVKGTKSSRKGSAR